MADKALNEKIQMELEELLENSDLKVDSVQIVPILNVIKTFGGRVVGGGAIEGYEFYVKFKVKE